MDSHKKDRIERLARENTYDGALSDMTVEEILFNLLVDVAEAYEAEIQVNGDLDVSQARDVMLQGLKENLEHNDRQE